MENTQAGLKNIAELVTVSPSLKLIEKQQGYVDEYKPKIAEALGDLDRALERLSVALQEARYAVVFEPIYSRTETDNDGNPVIERYVQLDHNKSLEAAISAYCTLELEPDDPINKPVRCHGAIGVGARVINLAKEVNRLKSVLKATFQPLSNYRIPATIKRRRKDVVTMIPISLYILRQLQRSSLNRLGAYKPIPLIRTGKTKFDHPPTPLSISFTETWTASMVRRSVDELIKEAAAADREHTVHLLEHCKIPGNEYVYSPKRHYLRMRANLYFPGTTANRVGPKNYMAELPIMYLLKARQTPPTCSPPRPRDPDSKGNRSKAKLMDDPIIPSSKPNQGDTALRDYTAYYRRDRAQDREFSS